MSTTIARQPEDDKRIGSPRRGPAGIAPVGGEQTSSVNATYANAGPDCYWLVGPVRRTLPGPRAADLS